MRTHTHIAKPIHSRAVRIYHAHTRAHPLGPDGAIPVHGWARTRTDLRSRPAARARSSLTLCRFTQAKKQQEIAAQAKKKALDDRVRSAGVRSTDVGLGVAAFGIHILLGRRSMG
jgi:hypothetical protein